MEIGPYLLQVSPGRGALRFQDPGMKILETAPNNPMKAQTRTIAAVMSFPCSPKNASRNPQSIQLNRFQCKTIDRLKVS